jgi:hypothetical protein
LTAWTQLWHQLELQQTICGSTASDAVE